MVDNKKCSGCLRVLEFKQFSKHKDGKFGLKAKCKNCISKYAKQYYTDVGQTKYRAKANAKTRDKVDVVSFDCRMACEIDRIIDSGLFNSNMIDECVGFKD